MNPQNDLTAMRERIFTDKLLDKLLDAYHQEMEQMHFTIAEDYYNKAKAALEYSLTDEQKVTLSEVEASWRRILNISAGLGFSHGLYAGFKKAFVPDAPEDPFQSFVVDELLAMPNMEHYSEYISERNKALMLYTYLFEQVNEIVQEHLTSIESAWDERLYSILRYTFDMGYQEAASIVDEIEHRMRGIIIRIGK